jgi:hypothetical protein
LDPRRPIKSDETRLLAAVIAAGIVANRGNQPCQHEHILESVVEDALDKYNSVFKVLSEKYQK